MVRRWIKFVLIFSIWGCESQQGSASGANFLFQSGVEHPPFQPSTLADAIGRGHPWTELNPHAPEVIHTVETQLWAPTLLDGKAFCRGLDAVRASWRGDNNRGRNFSDDIYLGIWYEALSAPLYADFIKLLKIFDIPNHLEEGFADSHPFEITFVSAGSPRKRKMRAIIKNHPLFNSFRVVDDFEGMFIGQSVDDPYMKREFMLGGRKVQTPDWATTIPEKNLNQTCAYLASIHHRIKGLYTQPSSAARLNELNQLLSDFTFVIAHRMPYQKSNWGPSFSVIAFLRDKFDRPLQYSWLMDYAMLVSHDLYDANTIYNFWDADTEQKLGNFLWENPSDAKSLLRSAYNDRSRTGCERIWKY